jgi:hypothetical protein
VHIDAVLQLYAPEVEPESIAPKAVRQRNEWFKPGELSCMMLDILRTAPALTAGREIAAGVMQRRGLDAGDARTAHLVGKLVHNVCTRPEADLVERAGDEKIATWWVAG